MTDIFKSRAQEAIAKAYGGALEGAQTGPTGGSGAGVVMWDDEGGANDWMSDVQSSLPCNDDMAKYPQGWVCDVQMDRTCALVSWCDEAGDDYEYYVVPIMLDPASGDPCAAPQDQWTCVERQYVSVAKALDAEAAMLKAYTADQRAKLAEQGKAIPIKDSDGKVVDGSYPIDNVDDLKRAIEANGRAKPSEQAQVRAHIKRQAKALGHSELIPKGW